MSGSLTQRIRAMERREKLENQTGKRGFFQNACVDPLHLADPLTPSNLTGGQVT